MSFIKDDTVAILMCTYQGENFIDQQLNSFKEQSYKDWELYVSDDGSIDRTREKIIKFAESFEGKVRIFSGPKKGFVANFLSLITNPGIDATYYAFADQDDIWYKNKIERAVNWHRQQDPTRPALYCSRTQLINSEGISVGYSPLFKKSPNFSNALVQNIGGGNTMVLNKKARELVLKTGVVDVVSHDWWIYILIAGAGGLIHYDPESTIYYRQHEENLIGANRGFKARINRMLKILQGSFRTWNKLHLTVLAQHKDLLLEENQKKISQFEKIHNSSLLLRIYYFKAAGLYRQNSIETLAIFLAAVFKRL